MDINAIISAYIDAKNRETEAKKEKEKLASLILEHAKGADFFQTDAYNVVIDKRTRTGIDTKALYKDFPDIKDAYGTITEYNVITAKEKASAGKKSA